MRMHIQPDMTKLTVAFCNFANAPVSGSHRLANQYEQSPKSNGSRVRWFYGPFKSNDRWRLVDWYSAAILAGKPETCFPPSISRRTRIWHHDGEITVLKYTNISYKFDEVCPCSEFQFLSQALQTTHNTLLAILAHENPQVDMEWMPT